MEENGEVKNGLRTNVYEKERTGLRGSLKEKQASLG